MFARTSPGVPGLAMDDGPIPCRVPSTHMPRPATHRSPSRTVDGNPTRGDKDHDLPNMSSSLPAIAPRANPALYQWTTPVDLGRSVNIIIKFKTQKAVPLSAMMTDPS